MYNIFLLSKSPTNQMVAQGALNQIVGSVFARVRPEARPPHFALSRSNTTGGARSPRPPSQRYDSIRSNAASNEATAKTTGTNGHSHEADAEERETRAGAEGGDSEQPESSARRSSADTVRPGDASIEQEGDAPSGPASASRMQEETSTMQSDDPKASADTEQSVEDRASDEPAEKVTL